MQNRRTWNCLRRRFVDILVTCHFNGRPCPALLVTSHWEAMFSLFSIAENRKRMKLTAYQRAQMAYEAKEAERRQKREEEEQQQKERQAALKKYRKKKFERLHKLSKKTSKGQPVMRGRIEVLLEKIQSSIAQGV